MEKEEGVAKTWTEQLDEASRLALSRAISEKGAVGAFKCAFEVEGVPWRVDVEFWTSGRRNRKSNGVAGQEFGATAVATAWVDGAGGARVEGQGHRIVALAQKERFAGWARQAFEKGMMEAASKLRASQEHRALREAADLRGQIKSSEFRVCGPERL